MTKRQRLIEIAEQRCDAARLAEEARQAMAESYAVFKKHRDAHAAAMRKYAELGSERDRLERTVTNDERTSE